MSITTAYSTKGSVDEVVQDLKRQLSGSDPRLLLVFASSGFDPERLARQIKDAFPSARSLGCTTAGEIVSGRMLKNSAVAMAFSPKAVADVRVEVLRNVRRETPVKEAFASFEKHYGQTMSALDSKKYVGLVLVDGLSGAEERIMESIGDLTDVTFIGGSAGDDLKFKGTYVFADGTAYTDAAVLALLQPAVDFDIIKTQSFRQLDKKLVATKVDEAKRTVLEFNYQPAATAYARALGVAEAEASQHFMHNPFGFMVDGEPSVRSPQQIQGQAMVFYSGIKNGTELALLEASNSIVKDTAKALADKKKQMGSISGIVNFHCILRTLELEKEKQMDAYGQVFTQIPTVGFSTYGEEYHSHLNQTSTMLVFK